VSRVHLPDQFVWGDWQDVETLGLLRVFMREVTASAGASCQGEDGHVTRSFDETADSHFFEDEWQDQLRKNAGECWR